MATSKLIWIFALVAGFALITGCDPVSVSGKNNDKNIENPDAPPQSEWVAFRTRTYSDLERQGFDMAYDAASGSVDSTVELIFVAADGRGYNVPSSELAQAKNDGKLQGYNVDHLHVVTASTQDFIVVNNKNAGLAAQQIIVHADIQKKLTASSGMVTISSTNADQSRTTVIGEAQSVAPLRSVM